MGLAGLQLQYVLVFVRFQFRQYEAERPDILPTIGQADDLRGGKCASDDVLDFRISEGWDGGKKVKFLLDELKAIDELLCGVGVETMSNDGECRAAFAVLLQRCKNDAALMPRDT